MADMLRLGSVVFWRSAVCTQKEVRPVCALTCKVRASADLSVMEGDVVEYPLPADCRAKGWNKGVGVIADLRADAQTAHIEPLVQEEAGWIYDESQQGVVVPMGEVRVLQTWYSERMVPDRISNPHGEHAESLWIIEDSLSPDCGPPATLLADE